MTLMAKAAIDIPDDYLEGIKAAAAVEDGDLSSFVLQAMLENYQAAKEDRRPMCGDTGSPRWYVKMGNEAQIEGGPIALEHTLRQATAQATNDIPLRPNRVHPLWRTDHNNNIGINAPEIEYAYEPEGEWLDLITVHKGGLFGTDYRMLFPSDGIEGIRRFYLDCLIAFGKRGLACQPAIFGVGLGGNKDACMVHGKRAACLRTVGDRNPDPKIAALELELTELGNSIGMGAMGFVGKSMVIDTHIEVGYCHTGGMQMSFHAFCLSSRRAVARIYPDGRVEYRTDPEWFTPYQRRETVEWPPTDEATLKSLELGNVVYLNGVVYTAREGVYMKVVDNGAELPLDLPGVSATNFHCSPAAAQRPDGSYDLGAVSATASFRFRKWLDGWFKISGAKFMIGKGGMSSEDYRRDFVPNGAIYLTTVGYGTGALLGRGVKRVRDVHWLDELGIAQAMWILEVENLGPFMVESNMNGNSLFERENEKIAERLPKLYEGTRPALLKRFGETDDRKDELI
jgi:L(+)-tartrate dehydratase alpha subunit